MEENTAEGQPVGAENKQAESAQQQQQQSPHQTQQQTQAAQQPQQRTPQQQTQTSQPKPEGETKLGKLKKFFRECLRVVKVLKKPNKEEFLTTAKVSAIGLAIIGLIGFVLSLAQQLILR